MIGEQVGGYTVDRLLGRGHFGAVYLVTKAGKEFAAKFVNITTQSPHQRVLRQANIQLSLSNRFLMRAYEVFLLEQKKQLVIIMDYCDLGSLADMIPKLKKVSDGAQRIGMARSIMLQISKGMKILHVEHLIMHRDLKPENIMMNSEGLCIISDFGISKIVSDGNTSYCGTPFYMAPEIFALQQYNLSVDIFSLGIVFLELMTQTRIFDLIEGRLPPGNRSDFPSAQLLKKIPNDRARQLIQRMLKKNPIDRPNIEEVCDFIKANNFSEARQKLPEEQYRQSVHNLLNEGNRRSPPIVGNSPPRMLVPVQKREIVAVYVRRRPGSSYCQRCGDTTESLVNKKVGLVAGLWIACLLVTLPPLFFIPICVDKCKDTEEVCSNCYLVKSVDRICFD